MWTWTQAAFLFIIWVDKNYSLKTIKKTQAAFLWLDFSGYWLKIIYKTQAAEINRTKNDKLNPSSILAARLMYNLFRTDFVV